MRTGFGFKPIVNIGTIVGNSQIRILLKYIEHEKIFDNRIRFSLRS